MKILNDVSLVIATYNKKAYLSKSLESLMKQSYLPGNVILADDGSSDTDLDNLIEQYQKNLPVPLIRVWHEDRKWRKPLCVNKAVHQANEYIIFIDEDVIMHPLFIINHWKYRKPNTALYGTTAMLTPKMTEILLNIEPFQDAWINKEYKKRNTLYLPFPSWLRFTMIRLCIGYWIKTKIYEKIRLKNLIIYFNTLFKDDLYRYLS